MASWKLLQLHADDFGMNSAVNAGIAAAFRRGLLTGTSLIANAPAIDEACRLIGSLQHDATTGDLPSADRRRRLGDDRQPLDFGIHVNLTQGAPLTSGYPEELRLPSGDFAGVWQLWRRLAARPTVYLDRIRKELAAQFDALADRGCRPTHCNGHQYVELLPTVSQALVDLLNRWRLPRIRFAYERGLVWTTLAAGSPAAWVISLVKRRYAREFVRRMTAQGLRGTDCFFGTAHAGAVSRQTLRRFLLLTPPGASVEVGLHPAVGTPGDAPSSRPWADPLSAARPRELDWLTDRALVDELLSMGCRLSRFHAI